VYRMRRGVGQVGTPVAQVPVIPTPGVIQSNQTPDCTNWFTWLIDSDCWVASPSEWAAYPTPPAPLPPTAPTGSVLTVPPASGAEAQSTVNQLVAQTTAANQQQASDFFSTVQGLPSTLSWGALLGIGVAGAALLFALAKG